MDVVWLDVSMAMKLTGSFHPLTEIGCDVPVPVPAAPDEWQQWATAQLAKVADYEAWQPGHYSYSVSRRDDQDRPVEVFTRGQWELGR